MTPGERRVARCLTEKLDAACLTWYNVPIGTRWLHPDFIVLLPNQGNLIILEVKDWQLDYIQQINRSTVMILDASGELVKRRNPIEQARDYAMAVSDLLKRDQQLTHASGRYQGKLLFPYSYGAVFPNITRKQLESQTGLNIVLPFHLVICKDEIAPQVSPENFQNCLLKLCEHPFGRSLNAKQVDRIRWRLFPEIRINHYQLSLVTAKENSSDPPVSGSLAVMDLEQEKTARSLGDGHRVIHGAAGTGKTMILIYRCLKLADEMDGPILVLCYNVALAVKLQQMLNQRGVGDHVQVWNFHRWCSKLLEDYRIPLLRGDQSPGKEEMVQRVIYAVEGGRIPSGQYSAILIDEGHDFEPEWLRLVARMVRPETQSLLLLYDDAQSIYSHRQHHVFSFKSVGIQAQGRTKILRLNYRNTQEILDVAYGFVRDLLFPTGNKDDDDDHPILVPPQSAGRHGPLPELSCQPDFAGELGYIAERVAELHRQGIAWNDMMIVYRVAWMAERIFRYFQKSGIPLEWVNRDRASRRYHPDQPSIKLITLHSSKGLEFPTVLIPGLGYMPHLQESLEDEARLLYVAMTRAIDRLIMTCDRPSEFVERLRILMNEA